MGFGERIAPSIHFAKNDRLYLYGSINASLALNISFCNISQFLTPFLLKITLKKEEISSEISPKKIFYSFNYKIICNSNYNYVV
jgi:hypothetical protein